ncbi:MAG: MG2 domain-containing protein [Myxococcota bacterium]
MSELRFKKSPIRRWFVLGVLASLGFSVLLLSLTTCLRAWLFAGIWVPECPAGEVRQTLDLSVSNARRGPSGTIAQVRAEAHYTTGLADAALSAPISRLSADFYLVDAQGKETRLDLSPKTKVEDLDTMGLLAQLALPDVPDGDYKLRAKVKTPVGADTIDAALGIYAPAKIHVLADRPLVQPGQTVRFRALGLRASDLVPLDGRPGSFSVRAPSGETIFEERAPLGDFGVASGSFPVDTTADNGEYVIEYRSGNAAGTASFRVEPFTLPRFRVELSPSRAFYRPHDVPRLSGSVRYSSGAPVAGAALSLSWSVSGAWPPPADWIATKLPHAATADPAGRFNLELPAVPADLQGQARLLLSVEATDAAQDRVHESTSFLLSEDGIGASAVTELGSGLVESYNNRLYVRVTTPEGTPLASTDLLVKRAWEPTDRGIPAQTDEDGVAALQIDPGPAVNVVIPALPYRPPPRPTPVVRGGVTDLIANGEPRLEDQLAMDRWPGALEACARYAPAGNSASASIALRVSREGQILGASEGLPALDRCLVQTLAGLRMPPGPDRVFTVEITVNDPGLPSLSVSVTGASESSGGVEAALETAALDARACLPPRLENGGPLQDLLVWRLDRGERRLGVSTARDRGIGEEAPAPVSAAAMSCIVGRFSAALLEEKAEASGLGVARLTVVPAEIPGSERPQPTVMLGYELEIQARAKGENIGKTKLRLSPGAIPMVRLRATPILPKPGETVVVEILRGPGAPTQLPDELWLSGRASAIKAKVDKETKTARFALPADARGFYQVSFSTGRALVFVKSDDELRLSLRPDKDRYAPGDTARLSVKTERQGKGAPAAVGLFGVDQSLAQLAALPGPGELEQLRPRVETPDPAFGALDGQALAMGRIRGANAAQAVTLRVAGPPAIPASDEPSNAHGETAFDPLEALTDRFYVVLAELTARVRDWEAKAPEKEQMRPATMARLWAEALSAVEKRGDKTEDAFGRRLRLSILPPDLLAMTAPNAVVIHGTRLPEDVEDWAAWVQKERP